MKSAEQVAEEIYQELILPKTSLKYGDPTTLIAGALKAYADEKLDEAVRIADLHPPCENACNLLEAISALKSTPAPGAHK